MQKQPRHLSGQRLGNVRTRFCTFIKLQWQPRTVLSRPSLISRYPQAPADEVTLHKYEEISPVVQWSPDSWSYYVTHPLFTHTHISRHVHYLYYLYLDIHSKYQSYSTSDTDVNIVNGWSHQPSPAQPSVHLCNPNLVFTSWISQIIQMSNVLVGTALLPTWQQNSDLTKTGWLCYLLCWQTLMFHKLDWPKSANIFFQQ